MKTKRSALVWEVEKVNDYTAGSGGKWGRQPSRLCVHTSSQCTLSNELAIQGKSHVV